MIATELHNQPEEHYVSSTAVRTLFSRELSNMYRLEVPLYGDLIDLISDVNTNVLHANPQLKAQLEVSNQTQRLDLERHGAIRLGSPEEMKMMARFLRIMGMYPVGYYDLAEAKLPVHATCFRTLDSASLAENPFRLFVSLLRPSLLPETLREKTREIVSGRKIFVQGAIRLIEMAEENQLQLTGDQAQEFVTLGINTFRWHASSVVTMDTYKELDSAVPLLADIVCFRGPHVNHLTPRTLDIDEVQREMKARGFPTKAVIEGPPRRKCPILLRQTSFKALEERISFIEADGKAVQGAHTARFGEVEERGAALTPKGRALYDRIIKHCRSKDIGPSHEDAYRSAFADFPDDWQSLQREGLVWFRYIVTEPSEPRDRGALSSEMVERLEDNLPWFTSTGWLVYEPIVYEDFLPLSAAGIFASNLKTNGDIGHGCCAQRGSNSKEELQRTLDGQIEDEMANYAQLQLESLTECKATLRALL